MHWKYYTNMPLQCWENHLRCPEKKTFFCSCNNHHCSHLQKDCVENFLCFKKWVFPPCPFNFAMLFVRAIRVNPADCVHQHHDHPHRDHHHYQQHHRHHQQVRKHHLSLRCWAPAAFFWPQILVSRCLTLHKWFDWDQDGDEGDDGDLDDDDRDDVDGNDHNSDDDSYNVAQAALHIQGVGRGDEGEYSCQVSTFWKELTFLQFGWIW